MAMESNLNCWEIKRCAASQYLNCKAFSDMKHCWEVSNPRCSRSLLLCVQVGCPVYDCYMVDIDNEIKSRLKLMFPLLSSIEDDA